MDNGHVTHSQLKNHIEEHIQPIKGDVSKVLDSMTVMQRELTENSISMKHIAKSIDTFIVDIEPRVRVLEKSNTEKNTYWSVIKWIGGPSVLALWFFLISNAWTQLGGQ